MEFIIGIIVVLAIYGWLSDDSSSSSSYSSFGNDSVLPDRFEMKLNKTEISHESFSTPKEAIEVKCKGFLFLSGPKRIGAIISLFDVTDGVKMPVLSLIDSMAESGTNCFQLKQDLGIMKPGYGYTDWVVLSAAFTEVLHLPESGNRKLEVHLRLVDWALQPNITAGFVDPAQSHRILWESTKTINHQFDIKGYKEEKNNRLLANELTIKIGVAVAMSDSNLDPNEGEVIKGWIKKTLESIHEDEQEKYKKLYNETFKESFKLAKTGDLLISPLIQQLHDLEMIDCSYNAIELSYKIMAADGVINASESDIMKTITSGLNLEESEIEKIRDRNLLGLNKSDLKADDLLNTLGIDPDLDSSEIKQKLSMQFQKWNNRLNIVSEDERAEVQNMLDKIAFARKEYE